MAKNSWIIDNLEHALDTWNEKMNEIWQLVTESPADFKGGGVWRVITDIHGALQATGLALLVLFFVIGVVKTTGNFAEVKKPEMAVKLFIRFVLAKAVVTYGLELMMALFTIVQGIISTMMGRSGFGRTEAMTLPNTIAKAIEDVGFWQSIPLWVVSLLGSLFITVLSFVMILSVYGRFFVSIYIRPSLPFRFPPLPGSRAKISVNRFSKGMRPLA
ncbi:hypothetical protein PACILC2_52620 [Paenibacillus cisolokensis]|uniref:Uncharacterized protein n=1 Tax=Paenibacillus cisolokensis TaxID=1658519 RepID=A0ABQ4NFJ2_9BACL|nr:hypothetical protein PACILC2_52620 [Paenibacillus cisolokensis]